MAFFGNLVQGASGTGSGTFGSIGSQIASKLVSGSLIIVLVIIFCVIIVAIAFWLRYLSQFVYKVEIKSRRSSGMMGKEDYKIIEDKGAMIRNRKDKTTWFRLKGQMVDLPPPPLEAIQLGVKGKNYVKIFQKSDDEYYYLIPEKINMETVIKDGREIFLGQENVKIIDGDVAFWNIQRKKVDKKLFDAESTLMKILPYIIPVLMFMLVIFMTYFITQHWGEFSTAAQALERAADRLATVSSAEVKVTG